MEWKILFVFCVVNFSYLPRTSAANERLQVVTVATEETDGFHRFMRTVRKYQLNVKVLGMGEKWEGGNMAMSAGGGQKVMLLRKAMEELKDEKDLIVMFVDSYDLIFTAGEKDILQAFKKFNAKVVFSAEDFCWPDKSLESQYPIVRMTEKRYLNSGGFIGYAPELARLVTRGQVKVDDDDQLFYTKLFLDAELREKLSVKLDTRGEIFQNLNGALDEVTLKFKGSSGYLYNSRTGNSPLIIHGNGPIKVQFNSLTNYLADQWTPTMGCQSCKENAIDLEGTKPEDLPQVMIGIFFDETTPFADVFFENVAKLIYPKDKIDVFIHYSDEFHKRHVDVFLEKHRSEYRNVVVYAPENYLTDGGARNRALEDCLKQDCLYYLSLDGVVQLENNRTLQTLIERNRSVIAPMMLRPGKLWSNFWGSINKGGYYQRSDDYVDLAESKRKGIWNVPHITNIYMIQAFRIPAVLGAYIDPEVDPDIAICARLREKDIFMHVDNQEYYGHLVNPESFTTSHLHNDLYEIFENKYTWEKKYVHPEYHQALAADTVNPQPCTDVYWFPIVTTKFCEDYIGEMENFGKWSGGKNQDERLAGGYENVPTVDIHTNQIGWEKHWLHFLKEYILPLNAKVFLGYISEARAIMNFVVRYTPGEQDRLRPHHDSSTFTVNIALNTPKVDYEGGGPRFLRYDCAVAGTRRGWMLMHPGRMTHFHEGMPVTKGTRYIMVSFVDP